MALAKGHLRFSDVVPHEVAKAGDWARARRIHVEHGKLDPGNEVRELRDFYERDERTLWITMGEGRLWWAFAGVQVEPQGPLERVRRTMGPWSCLDAEGREIGLQGLSSRLTKTRGFPRTICSIEAEAYLLRRLRAEADPLVRKVEDASDGLRGLVGELIAGLDPRDFELLVDMIFAASGWRRIGGLGGSDQPDTDLVLEQIATGERAFVQVKSRASATELRRSLIAFSSHPGFDRFFFACHSPTGRLEAAGDARVHLWLRNDLADRALRAGLLEWLVERQRQGRRSTADRLPTDQTSAS